MMTISRLMNEENNEYYTRLPRIKGGVFCYCPLLDYETGLDYYSNIKLFRECQSIRTISDSECNACLYAYDGSLATNLSVELPGGGVLTLDIRRDAGGAGWKFVVNTGSTGRPSVFQSTPTTSAAG